MTRADLSVFISEVCANLEISLPKISFEMPEGISETTMSVCSPITGTIHIKNIETITPDIVFSIVHELRHLWQHINKQDWLSGYRNSTELNIEEYNLQQAEIDANAYAAIVMNDCFGIMPLFIGLSENVKSEIKRRINEIIREN